MQNSISTILFVFGFAGIGLVFAMPGYAYAQGVNEIYGYVFEEITRTPVVAAEVWYCSSSVPEEFPMCFAQQFGQTDGAGKWVFQNPVPNHYYRIWATKSPGAYSQAFAQFYSGGSIPWVDLLMEGVYPTSNVTVLFPNKGCVYVDGLVNNGAVIINWSTALTDVARFILAVSDSEFVYETIAQVSGNLRSYSWIPDRRDAWQRIAVVAQGSQGQFLGQDFSDGQFIITKACSARPAEALNIRVTARTDAYARIQWETNIPVVSTVEYKIGTLARPDGFATAVTSDFTTSHDTLLTYLSPDSTYYYYIRLWDAARNEFRTETFSFTTRANSSLSVSPQPQVSSAEIQEVIVTKPATEEIIAEIPDGVRVIIPPAAALTEGAVTLTIQPVVEPVKESGIEVVGAVYDIRVQDAAQRIIKDLVGEIEIVLPYRDADIKKIGVGENKISPAYFDESGGRWIKIENYTQDTVRNAISARVNHLTRFAIVAAADITPSAAPTGVAIRALEKGGIGLSWKNPARDFHHAKIYRSERAGMLGAVVGNEILGQEFKDHETGAGILYYYTVRAVDPAGNESLNKKQYSVRATGAALAGMGMETALRFQNLRVGNSGERVRIVQEILAGEGLYPAGLVRGYFDEYTKQAVILFQEKYAADILIPVGLSRGTGIVGIATWRKINELQEAKAAEEIKIKEDAQKPKEILETEERVMSAESPPRFFIRWWRALLLFIWF